MRLIACPRCHAHLDASRAAGAELRCPCGARVPNTAARAVEAEVRCCASCGAALAPAARRCDYCGSPVVRDAAELSMICPECFARNPRRARYCAACGVEFRPVTPLGEDQGPPLACPACGEKLLPRRIADRTVSECPACHGLWAEGEAFARLVEHALEVGRRGGFAAELVAEARRSVRPRPNPVARPVAYRRCPVCGGLMQRRNFRRVSGVILDWCGPHGTWLDADELEQIAAFLLEEPRAGEREPQPPLRGWADTLRGSPEPERRPDLLHEGIGAPTGSHRGSFWWALLEQLTRVRFG